MNVKRILLVASPYMGLYEDIQKGLEDLGFFVDLILEKSFPNNPNIVLHKKKPSASRINEFQGVLLDYWKGLLDCRSKEDLFFDYLLVINGKAIHPYLFEKLKKENKDIKTFNYIYDRIKGVYQIDHNFKYFDDIYTFDRNNVEEYNLKLLPIYWVPESGKLNEEIDVFAFGGPDQIRINVFRRIKEVVADTNLRCYIKVYHPAVTNKAVYSIRRISKYVLQGRKSPSLKELRSDLFTSESMPTDIFRKYINSAKVIIDSNHPYQDGLTARFMWSLGLGKKIITNNKNILKYDFYSKEQIFVIDDNTRDQELLDFITSKTDIPPRIKGLVDLYRIDNWLKTILGLEQ